jgi:hypothetical protein
MNSVYLCLSNTPIKRFLDLSQLASFGSKNSNIYG